jgi:glycosyltransferase involved in cell wall biosynthesis
MVMLPQVSILIPCHNADRWIAQAIESALNQTYPHKEVIVVDDGSTDRSLEIIHSFGDRIHWETQPNQGGNATRNRLLELSNGEWLQYLDADDYLLPHKLEQQVQVLSQGLQADVIYGASIYEYWGGESVRQETVRQETVPIPQPHDPWILLARWFLPQTGSPLWRRQAIVDVGGWKTGQPCCQEHELYLRLLMAGKVFQYSEAAGSVYRQWSEGTVCKRNKPEVFRQRLSIEDRLEQYLQTHDLLTPSRQYAINQARFECARIIWLSDRQWAEKLIATIKLRQPNFIPIGYAAPPGYRLTYKLLGFSIAEQLAHFKRKLKKPNANSIASC